MPLKKHTLTDGVPTVTAVNAANDASDAFDADCDVLVIGLGTAGVMAAIAAAKQDCRVIGADAAPLAGGVGTAACVWDYYYGARGGLYREINRKADALLAGGVYLSTAREGISTYPTSVKSLALEGALDALGVTRYYGSAVTAVYTGDGRLCGAELSGERDSVRIRASVVIDGADGAVCRLLGLPTLPGRKCDNRTARFARTVAMRDGEGRLCGAWHQGDALPQDAGTEELSARFLRWSAKPPCYAEHFDRGNRLLGLGCITGIREAACYETEEVYTFTDWLDEKRSEKVAFYALSQLDNSCADVWNEDDDFVDWHTLCNMNPYAFSVGISPDLLMAKGIDNLLLAGKHIGTGHILTSGVRMRSDMEKLGEAAGVLAALCVSNRCSAKTVANQHFPAFREILSKSGCYDVDNDRGVCDLNVPDRGMWRTCILPQTAEELKECLSGITPSLGLLAVRLRRVAVDDRVTAWLTAENRLLRENTAVALGMLGDRRALPVLRDILRGDTERYLRYWDEFQYGWHAVTDLCNFIKAACLLARFRDPADEALMKEVAFYDGENEIRTEASHYAKRYFGIFEPLEEEA